MLLLSTQMKLRFSGKTHHHSLLRFNKESVWDSSLHLKSVMK